MIIGWAIGFVVGCICGYIVGRTAHSHIQTNVGNNSVQIQTINKNVMDNKLLPCKKCGKPNWRHLHYIPEAWRISCSNCGYCTKEKKTKNEAENAWNQR